MRQCTWLATTDDKRCLRILLCVYLPGHVVLVCRSRVYQHAKRSEVSPLTSSSILLVVLLETFPAKLEAAIDQVWVNYEVRLIPDHGVDRTIDCPLTDVTVIPHIHSMELIESVAHKVMDNNHQSQ